MLWGFCDLIYKAVLSQALLSPHWYCYFFFLTSQYYLAQNFPQSSSLNIHWVEWNWEADFSNFCWEWKILSLCSTIPERGKYFPFSKWKPWAVFSIQMLASRHFPNVRRTGAVLLVSCWAAKGLAELINARFLLLLKENSFPLGLTVCPEIQIFLVKKGIHTFCYSIFCIHLFICSGEWKILDLSHFILMQDWKQ